MNPQAQLVMPGGFGAGPDKADRVDVRAEHALLVVALNLPRAIGDPIARGRRMSTQPSSLSSGCGILFTAGHDFLSACAFRLDV